MFNFFKNLYKFFLIFIFFIVLLEIGSYLILKFNFINQKVHTYLTLNYVEVLKNQNVNLKKNVELKIDDWNIYTDKNRLRVKSNDFDHNLENDRPKIIFIGDSVTFGYGVNYKDSIPGNIESINNSLLSINASVPSYSIVQSVKKFEDEFRNTKNIKYVFLKIYNPTDMYLMLGKKWKKEINWYNYMNFLNKDKFIFKYKKIPFWGDINFFKILRKIYIMYFFRTSEFMINKRDKASDMEFTQHINDELNKLYNLLDKDTILILTPVINPSITKNNLNSEISSDIDLNRQEIINLINNELILFNKKNVIFFDTIKILKSYSEETLFIDECCHLSPLSARIISENLNKILVAN